MGTHELHLQRELCPLKEALKPAQYLGMREGQFLQRAGPQVGSELVEFLVQLFREGLAQLPGDLLVELFQVLDCRGLRPDPPSLLEHFAGDRGDSQETGGVDTPHTR